MGLGLTIGRQIFLVLPNDVESSLYTEISLVVQVVLKSVTKKGPGT